MSTFALWQPLYAEHGIPTFPVLKGVKKPAVTGYLRMGLPASRALVARFGHLDAFGFALKRANITVLDVDTPDERVLADALTRQGRTRIIVRTQSGNWQAWYRNGGEGRSVRPFPSLPIDVLSKGYVVAPPSNGAKGVYGFVEGSLDDLVHLPLMRGAPDNDNRPGCYRLAHASQSEGSWDRSLRRANKLKQRLGGDPGLVAPFPPKPRGMWWRTYERLRAQAFDAEEGAHEAFVLGAQRLLARIDDTQRKRTFWQ